MFLLSSTCVFAAIYKEKVSGAFRKAIEITSSNLEVDPDHLIAVMALETAKPTNPGRGTPTFDPSIQNATTQAVGLIQFMPRTATDLGTTTTALKAMSAVDQMVWVEKYLRPYKGKMTTLVDTYLAVFYPAAIGKPDNYKLPDWAYAGNEGLDVNNDKTISKGEVAQKIQRYYDRGL